MASRMAQEFPAVRWQTVPSRGIDHEQVRRSIERGRRLRSRAIRRAGRTAFAGLRHGVAGIAWVLRCAGLALAGRPERSDCWRRTLRRA